MEKNNTTYDESSIQSYDTRTGIRKKLSMYLGDIGQKGSFKAIQEIFLNSLDEYKQSNCSLDMNYDTKTKIYTNFDTGRGIPLGKLYEIMTTLHSGGKLDTTVNNTGYEDSFGSNGCGLAIVNAISDWFIIECHREGKSKRLEFKDGYKENEIDRDLNKDDFASGTYIQFKLSEEVLGDTNIDLEQLIESAELMSYTSPKFSVNLSIDNKTYKFYSENGLTDFIEVMIKRNRWNPMFKPLKFAFDSKDYISSGKPLIAQSEILLTFDTKPGDKILAYTNRFKNIEGGSHVQGLKSALTSALNKYMEDNDKIPKKYEKMDVSASAISNNTIALVSVTMKNPFFKNQTKDQLLSTEVVGWVKSKMYNIFLNWLNANPREADKLVKLILNVCEANWAAKQAKNKVLGINDKQNFASSSISKRLNDCLSRDPEECEVYIVEGESASVGSVRNSNNQAYYLLRGKILNVVKNKNPYNNEILMDFINMLGCGFGEKTNVDKLRYHKIIILTDADKDGQHIAALILGFLFKYYPDIINRGHVFLGNPPLMKVTTKSNKTLFIKDEHHLSFILVQMMKKVFSVHSQATDNQIPDNIIEGIFYGLRDYSDTINNYSRQLNITPELLELIILYYKDIQNKNYKVFIDKGFKVKVKESDKYKTVIEFDEDIHHYLVSFNSSFYNEVYRPIFNKIAKDIGFYNIYLKNRETNDKISGSLYFISNLMNSLLDGKNVKESRFYKGLGEMSSEDLKTSCMDPETRLLTRITMKDMEHTDKIIQTFLGDTYQEEKKARLERRME